MGGCLRHWLANYAKELRKQMPYLAEVLVLGNELCNHMIQILAPGTEIITPIRDKKLSREAEVEYLKTKGIIYSAEKAKYSINKGIWGTSVGGKETLNSMGMLPRSMANPGNKERQ